MNGYFFLADLHALTTQPTKTELDENSKKILSTLFALLEDKNIIIYRQSKITEIFQLSFILNCYCAKGLLNRAHAYKSKVEDNIKNNNDPDKSIFMGLYSYPVLMAADILLFNPNVVPIGKDQIQHFEIMKEIALKINHKYKKEIFKLPHYYTQLNDSVYGLDGRKMSKSYNNVISPFSPDKKKIFSIPTNSKNIGEPKFEDESNITKIYKSISTQEEYKDLLNKMKEGIGWGEIKSIIFNKIENLIPKNKKNKYFEYVETNSYLNTLEQNEQIVRQKAKENLERILYEIGC